MRRHSIRITATDAVYAIGIVSKLLDMPEWTLRTLEKEGLVQPKRVNRKVRFYSMQDIRRIEEIKYLMIEKGVNIKGVRIILEMREE